MFYGRSKTAAIKSLFSCREDDTVERYVLIFLAVGSVIAIIYMIVNAF
jgi:hypothetical protein